MDRAVTFRLFPVEGHFCSMADYGAIVTIARRLGAQSALEFGPGYSTLALIEAGVPYIDCCEDNEHWAEVARKRLEDVGALSGQVSLFAYQWAEPLTVPALEAINRERYDLALVDGPHNLARREAVVEYCMTRAKAVLVPLEESHGPLMHRVCDYMAARHGATLEIIPTGPLAGAFGLLTT